MRFWQNKCPHPLHQPRGGGPGGRKSGQFFVPLAYAGIWEHYSNFDRTDLSSFDRTTTARLKNSGDPGDPRMMDEG
jgi:hypothetical protein